MGTTRPGYQRWTPPKSPDAYLTRSKGRIQSRLSSVLKEFHLERNNARFRGFLGRDSWDLVVANVNSNPG